jgi:hypothetical protein
MMKTLNICRAVGLLFLSICVPLLTSKAISYFMVSTLNLNGARDVRKRACLFETFNLKKTDIMMLQETHSDVFNETDGRREFEGTYLMWWKSG